MGAHSFRSLVATLLLCLVSACGGGGGGDAPGAGGGGGGGGGGNNPPPTYPDLAVLFVSGHYAIQDLDPAYLRFDAGPEIIGDLQNAGYSLNAEYFVDHPFPVGGYGGFLSLVDEMEALRDNWISHGTRVVVVAHSHGGVWAHEAIRLVPGLPIAALVDLDCSSYGWGTVGHDDYNAYIGGDPRDAFDIGLVVNVPAYPNVSSEQTGVYDSEDVVFSNVAYALEVRSGDSFPLAFEPYDEKWNMRANGTTSGLSYYYSGTTHTEVHTMGGATLAYARNWLRARLAP